MSCRRRAGAPSAVIGVILAQLSQNVGGYTVPRRTVSGSPSSVEPRPWWRPSLPCSSPALPSPFPTLTVPGRPEPVRHRPRPCLPESGRLHGKCRKRHGHEGGLTLLDAEQHQPYDRPPLSKHVLTGAWEPTRAQLRTAEQLAALEAEFILGEAAVACDAAERTVTTAGGRILRADAVVLATGLRARGLPGQETLAGVHVLRTMEDALRLRRDLTPGKRLVVVGEGVLGAEIAMRRTRHGS